MVAFNLHQAYPPATRGKIVLWGYLGAYPFGGMTWQVLHYLAGLRKLGFDVWYVEDTDAAVRDPVTLWDSENCQPNIDYLSARMESVGLADRWIFRPPGNYETCFGAAGIKELARLYRDADAVINLCGSHELRAQHDNIDCLVYLETDPVPKQIAVADGDPRTICDLSRYRYLFTYGENLGHPDCSVPLERFNWQPTRPPVIVDWWKSADELAKHAPFSTVTSWAKNWNDVIWQGHRWRWSKHHRFRAFKSLPEKTPVPLELAIAGIDRDEAAEFRSFGWRVRSASDVSDPGVYRDYICHSLGEFTVTKEQYVLPRTGWFSDRSVCYLAAGKPVITEETGFSKFFPCEKGLLPFVTEQDAVNALNAVVADYERHCSAATSVANEFFSADRVLHRMMATIGLL